MIDTARLAQRRRVFDLLERKVVELYLARPDEDVRALYDSLRYALSFARTTGVRTRDGVDVDVDGPLQLHAWTLRDQVAPLLDNATSLWEVARVMPDVVASTRRARASLLDHGTIPRDDLEEEVTTRLLAVASGGGGGAGFVYPGCYEQLEHHGLAPSLMVGTSIGALMSMFRARRARYDFAPVLVGAQALSWTRVFGAFQTKNRYGLPAALRLQLRHLLGSIFRTEDGERPLWLSDMGIPLYIVATGITMDALKHDLDFYENLLHADLQRPGVRSRIRTSFKTIGVIREFLARRESLRQVVLGRTPGTEDFDVLDAAGFSAAIPGVIHYDVLRDDPRMIRILDALYAEHGITRLGEGGMVSNVPAKICWETVASGEFGRRNVFVLALDCFAPHPRRLAWYPLMQAVRSANVEEDLKFADLYLDFDRTLSPMNLVPSVDDAMMAVKWGSKRMEPHMPFVTEMMRPIPVLRDS